MTESNNKIFFEKIGKIAIMFSNLDFFVTELICLLIANGHEDTQYLSSIIVHKENSINKKIKWCKNLFIEFIKINPN